MQVGTLPVRRPRKDAVPLTSRRELRRGSHVGPASTFPRKRSAPCMPRSQTARVRQRLISSFASPKSRLHSPAPVRSVAGLRSRCTIPTAVPGHPRATGLEYRAPAQRHRTDPRMLSLRLPPHSTHREKEGPSSLCPPHGSYRCSNVSAAPPGSRRICRQRVTCVLRHMNFNATCGAAEGPRAGTHPSRQLLTTPVLEIATRGALRPNGSGRAVAPRRGPGAIATLHPPCLNLRALFCCITALYMWVRRGRRTA